MFGALWDFKDKKVTAETVMTRAGLNSDKPNGIFKVKARDKGKQQYEDQHHAYVTLVKAHKREVCTGCRANPRTSLRPDGLLLQTGRRTRKIDTRISRCHAR